jgi:hypothetical protein
MRKPSALLLVVLVALVAACGDSDTSEQIEGVWENPADGVYVEFDEDGQYQAAVNPEVEGPFEWGDYTFDGETLTNNAAPDSSNCADTSATWTVVFSDDGDEASLTFVEDSCVGSARSQDLVFVRP